jgi:hypothetical protein
MNKLIDYISLAKRRASPQSFEVSLKNRGKRKKKNNHSKPIVDEVNKWRNTFGIQQTSNFNQILKQRADCR